MSKFDDEIARLEEEELNKDKVIKPLFPALTTNSKRETAKLANRVKSSQSDKRDKLADGLEEIIIPDSDTRTTKQTAIEALQKKSLEEFRTREEECGFCGVCELCKIYIYNSYKVEITANGYTLAGIEERITMQQKTAIVARERERALRDSWEDKIKEASDEEKAERLNNDRQYVPLTKENKGRISKAASDIAGKGKPKARVSESVRIQNAMAKLGIDMKSLMAAANQANKK